MGRGEIKRETCAAKKEEYSRYRIGYNRNRSEPTAFVTLAHELAHLFLGHLGDDPKLNIQYRKREHEIKEIEAESVAFIVCKRNGVECRSQSYLSGYVQRGGSGDLDYYAITKAAGHIERLLRLSRSSKWG